VNSLWISSLVISITSALLATMMQQWTRRYARVTRQLGPPHQRARIRQFLFNGVGTLHFLLVFDAVPTLLHLSVFLFFAGLLILLRHINHTVFNVAAVWVVFCTVVYTYITFLPVYRPASPSYAPISSLAWQVYADILYPLFESLSLIKKGVHIRRPASCLLNRLEEKAEEIVWGNSPKLDADILESLLVTLGEDSAREKFFEAIPGFYDSQVVQVDDVRKKLSPTFFTNFRHTVNQFLDQTLSSDTISELARSRRVLICLNATHRVLGDRASTSITDQIIRSGNCWIEMPPSPEIGHILRRWRDSTDPSISHIGSCMIARIIASVEKRDDTYMGLARSQLGVTERVLKGYMEHGDSVLLANLIKTTRLFFEKGLQFQDILRSISEFNVKDTLPELQHSFCALWNEIVLKSESSADFTFILDEICHVHEALHPTVKAIAALPTSTTANNDSPLLGNSYALCADPQSHRPFDAASRQITPVATSSSPSPRRDHPLLPPPREPPVEIQDIHTSQ
jgi:uncharacterized protein DUF6535